MPRGAPGRRDSRGPAGMWLWPVVATVAVAASRFWAAPPPNASTILHQEQSDFAHVSLEQDAEGHLRLLLDGVLQFSSADEYRYHEALVHPAFTLLQERPTHALVLGGGDGLAARELLRYEGVTVDLVDVDASVTRLFAEVPALVELTQGSLSSPRVRVHTADAAAFVAGEAAGEYDVVVVDLPDPTVPELAALYAPQVLADALRVLRPDGVLATQAFGATGDRAAFWCVAHTLQAVAGPRRAVRPYAASVPSFGDWGFVLVAPAGAEGGPLRVRTRYLTDALLPRLAELAADQAELPTPVNSADGGVLLRLFQSRPRLSVAAPAPPPPPLLETPDVDVAVVGGGVAGVTTAYLLQEGLGLRVALLEAGPRLGGRVESTAFPDGTPVDLGATWIHHAQQNPLLALARRHGCRTSTTENASSHFFRADGSRLPDAVVAAARELLQAEVMPAVLAAQATMPLNLTLDAAIAALLPPALSADMRDAVQLHLYGDLVQDLTADTAELSARMYDRGVWGGVGKDELVADGYWCLFRPWADALADVRLGARVAGVGGHAVAVAGQERRVVARAVVVAVPLAVLPELDLELDAAKARAVRELGVGRALRVALQFPSVFWPRDVHSLTKVGPDIEFTNVERVHPGSRVLVAEVDTGHAERLERLPDSAVAASVAAHLRQMYGDAYEPPERALVKRYGSDPLARGGFTFWPPHTGPFLNDDLERPSPPVFFAGEHTSSYLPGTVDGAFLSGVQAAHRVACALVGDTHNLGELSLAGLFEELFSPGCPLPVSFCDETFWGTYIRCRRRETYVEPGRGVRWEPIL